VPELVPRQHVNDPEEVVGRNTQSGDERLFDRARHFVEADLLATGIRGLPGFGACQAKAGAFPSGRPVGRGDTAGISHS